MTERQAEKWAITRAKGRKRFILVSGVMFWGLSTAILWTILMTATQGWSILPSALPFALIGFPIGGYFWGAFMWWFAEIAYRRIVSTPPSE